MENMILGSKKLHVVQNLISEVTAEGLEVAMASEAAQIHKKGC